MKRLLILALLTFPFPAYAAECDLREKIADFLAGKYQEHVIGRGLIGNQRFMEFYASETGTWTVLVTHVSGISCIVSAGQGFEDVPVQARVHPDA